MSTEQITINSNIASTEASEEFAENSIKDGADYDNIFDDQEISFNSMAETLAEPEVFTAEVSNTAVAVTDSEQDAVITISSQYLEDQRLISNYMGLMRQVIYEKSIHPDNVDDALQRMSLELLSLSRRNSTALQSDAFVADVFRKKAVDAVRAANIVPRSTVRHRIQELREKAGETFIKDEWEKQQAADNSEADSLLGAELSVADFVLHPVSLETASSPMNKAPSAEELSFQFDENTWLNGSFIKLELFDQLILSICLDIPTKLNSRGYVPTQVIGAVLSVSSSRVLQMAKEALERLKYIYTDGDEGKYTVSGHQKQRAEKANLLVNFIQMAGQQG